MHGEDIETIYLGGGTPSLLSESMLRQLFETIGEVCQVGEKAEITIECNPDDVSQELAQMLHNLPVNRVSMGIQTFDDSRLRFLHRRHSAVQGIHAVEMLRQAGMGNVSIDLMFGFPCESVDQWEHDICQALNLRPEHISAYSLMYEENTPLDEMRKKGLVNEVSDELYIIMYEKLVTKLREVGYIHYEISNFSLPGFHSRHNSGYWDETPYIGIGAAAHSYDINSRAWNVSDLRQYISSIENGILPSQREVLSETDRYNDLITTRLRTSKGICLDDVAAKYGNTMAAFLLDQAKAYIDKQWLVLENRHLHLTLKGIMMSDTVMSDLIKIE